VPFYAISGQQLPDDKTTRFIILALTIVAGDFDVKTSSAKKKPAKSLEAVLASVESDMAAVVAAIAAERKHRAPRRRARHHEPARAA
jgi:hypothetical protein